MRALVVHAHSEPDSFVSAMRDVIVKTLHAHDAQIDQSDLHAMGFNPVLSAADFGTRKDRSHLTYALEQRHNFDEGSLASDIVVEINKVQRADLVIFTFPIFWFSVPAILKGWIDRVFISGPFYGGRRIYGGGGMRGKRALAVFSLGGRPGMFGPGALHGELESGMLRHFLQGALGYVGFEVLKPYVAWHTPYIPAEERQRYLEGLAAYIEKIDTVPIMDMPDMAAFDERLSPLT